MTPQETQAIEVYLWASEKSILQIFRDSRLEMQKIFRVAQGALPLSVKKEL